MKHLIFLFFILVGASCAPTTYKRTPFTKLKVPMGVRSFVVVHSGDSMNHRPLFHVYLNHKFIMEHMYAEEIAECLRTGNWGYNEDLRICK
jgi:hypothetical protein